MSDRIRLIVDGREVVVPEGATVAAAILTSGCSAFRKSERGTRRGPLCGMGVCFECRVTINGRPHSRSCNVLCIDGMEVETDRA